MDLGDPSDMNPLVGTIVSVIDFLYGSLAEKLLCVQGVLVVAVFWLGVSLWIMVRSAAKYSKRVADLEGKITPYWKMVP